MRLLMLGEGTREMEDGLLGCPGPVPSFAGWEALHPNEHTKVGASLCPEQARRAEAWLQAGTLQFNKFA